MLKSVGPTFFASNHKKKQLSELLDAICQSNLDGVKKMLGCDSTLVLEKDDQEDTPLHVSLRNMRDPEIVGEILDKLTSFPAQYRQILTHANLNGETALHLVTAYGTSILFKRIAAGLNVCVYEQATKVTKDGKLPLALLELNNHVTRDIIRFDLEGITIRDAEIKNIKEAIDFEDVRKKHNYLFKEFPLLEAYLYFGCIAATYARRIIDECPSHPYVNKFSYEAREKLLNEFLLARKKCFMNMAANISPRVLFERPNEWHLRTLENIVSVLKDEKKGACIEYAYLILYALIKMGIKVPAAIYSIQKGDHGFVILGKGIESVLIDGLSGEVGWATGQVKRLSSFYWYKSENNKRSAAVLYPFDYQYHSIEPTSEFPIQDDFFANNQEFNLDVFDDCEKDKIILGIEKYGQLLNVKENIQVVPDGPAM